MATGRWRAGPERTSDDRVSGGPDTFTGRTRQIQAFPRGGRDWSNLQEGAGGERSQSWQERKTMILSSMVRTDCPPAGPSPSRPARNGERRVRTRARADQEDLLEAWCLRRIHLAKCSGRPWNKSNASSRPFAFDKRVVRSMSATEVGRLTGPFASASGESLKFAGKVLEAQSRSVQRAVGASRM